MALNLKQRHYLQSSDWGEFQQALGKKIVSRQGNGWSYQALIGPNPGRVAKYLKCVFLPYGPTFDNLESLKHALADIDSLAKEEKADQIVVEPYCIGNYTSIDNAMVGYKKLTSPRQPELTLITDLSKPWDEVLLGMSKTNRYQWRYLERDKISFEKNYDSKDIADFADMMRQTSDRTGARFPSMSYYTSMIQQLGPKKRAGVVYGLHNGERMVGTLYVDDVEAKRRYYLYAGSFDKMRDLKVALNATLVMYLQKDAQEQGLVSLDYFGVAPIDADKNHKWYGLSKFKRSLGGEDIITLGTWEKPVHKIKYKVVKIVQKVVSR